MSIKSSIKNLFSKGKNVEDKTSALKKKWLKNSTVKEWEQKGWLKEENDDVLAYLLTEWETRGELIPPIHKIKSQAIAEYGNKYKSDTLIETGTYLGKMINEQRENFKKIISIEVDPKFHADAIEKFKTYPHIKFYLGDSGKVLHEIMKDIDSPVVFWLDAHYNSRSSAKLDKECPIFEEMDAIFGSKKLDHIILIDDARLFVGKKDYPTIPELTAYIKAKRPDYKIEVKNDIIRVTK
ncbi:hypothetical protein BH09BAC5_BH09BAC5_27880 [soil metagenome]